MKRIFTVMLSPNHKTIKSQKIISQKISWKSIMLITNMGFMKKKTRKINIFMILRYISNYFEQ